VWTRALTLILFWAISSSERHFTLGRPFSEPRPSAGKLIHDDPQDPQPGSTYGYAIAKRIQDWSKGDLEIEDGSLYPALNRMLLKGWVKAEWVRRKTSEGSFLPADSRGKEAA